jgi:hypothetical protein
VGLAATESGAETKSKAWRFPVSKCTEDLSYDATEVTCRVGIAKEQLRVTIHIRRTCVPRHYVAEICRKNGVM